MQGVIHGMLTPWPPSPALTSPSLASPSLASLWLASLWLASLWLASPSLALLHKANEIPRVERRLPPCWPCSKFELMI